MRTMPPTPTYALIDRVLGGQLGQKLAAWRSEGLSSEKIARRLEAEHDIVVSGTTVHRWVSALAPSETVAP